MKFETIQLGSESGNNGLEIGLRHHGAQFGVTGSCHEILFDERKSLLVDCGIFQGAETAQSEKAVDDLHHIDFPVRDILALVVTHSHIDHIGRIPWLLAAGYKGPIICSEPSAKLMPLVLEDAFRLSVTRRSDVIENYMKMVHSRLIPVPYKTPYTLLDNSRRRVVIKLYRAGHILGSAYVQCKIADKEAKVTKNVVFSGDLGAPWAPILPAPKSPYQADLLVLESTYGDRLHEDRKNRIKRFHTILKRAFANGGTVLVPAFSLGRSQEMLYELEEIIHRGGLTGIPVILDSPLAGEISAAYRELKPWWDKEATRKLASGRRPLGFDGLITIEDHNDHVQMVRKLTRSKEPAVVIAGSGMCSGGRIVNYLDEMLVGPEHCVLFVGYQAAGTPGRDIQKYGPRGGYIYLNGRKIDIRAQVETIGGYSAHADQAGLVRFVKGMRYEPEVIRLVHGEPDAKEALRGALTAAGVTSKIS